LREKRIAIRGKLDKTDGKSKKKKLNLLWRI